MMICKVLGSSVKNSCDVWADCLLCRAAVVFVCGSASKMPQEVLQAFQRVLKQEAGLTSEDAVKYLKQLEVKGRYITEAWS